MSLMNNSENMKEDTMEAYLDNSATTRCSKKATEKMVELLIKDFGNPSSMHMKGLVAENYITEAKKKIARTLKVQDKEIVFTSGGTESNNFAIIGAAMANVRAGKHIITTKVEHASVSSTMAYLEDNGFEVTYLGVDKDGVISLEELKEAIRPDTILVSIMHVNNEIGAIMPVEEAGKIIKAANPNTVYHVDALQSYGKLIIRPKNIACDLLSVSGHKIHGPKGSGFLYIKDKTKIKPIIFGGGQQKGMRSGTENVPAIAGLGIAAEEIYTDFEKKTDNLYKLREYFVDELLKINGVLVNGKLTRENAPHIVSVTVPGVRSEVMLHTLEDRQIYVSAGSACSSNKQAVSATLKSIGLKPEMLEATVRFSFSVDTTKEELDYTIEVLKEVIPVLTKYTRR